MNRQILRLTLLAGACIWLVACTGGPAVSVKTDYNHKVSFNGYKTYALDLSEAPELRPTGRAALSDSLKSNLAARGITETSKGQADLVVVPTAFTQEKLHSMPTGGTTYVLSHPGYRYGNWYINNDVTQYTEGTLVLDFLDRQKHLIVFRGIGQGAMSTSERNAAGIRDAVAKIVDEFPK
jgi:hypothetical protein